MSLRDQAFPSAFFPENVEIILEQDKINAFLFILGISERWHSRITGVARLVKGEYLLAFWLCEEPIPGHPSTNWYALPNYDNGRTELTGLIYWDNHNPWYAEWVALATA